MLKRIYKKKLILITLAIITITLLFIAPDEKQAEVIYNHNYKNTLEVFMLKDKLLTRTVFKTDKDNTNELVDEVINVLNCNKQIDTSLNCPLNNILINKVSVDNDTVVIDIDNNSLNKLDNKIIESLTYSLTSINSINEIIIKSNNKNISELINVPHKLTREIGINKNYNINNYKDITKTTIYYKDDEYYTPITYINNDKRDKLEIIIEELSKNYENNIKVVNKEIKDNNLIINFNDNILDKMTNSSIKEDDIYMLALSIRDNYEVNNIFFNVNNKEIAKTSIKALE